MCKASIKAITSIGSHYLLHFLAIPCSLTVFHRGRQLKSGGRQLFSIGVHNEKALELDNRIVFYIFQPDFNVEISPKNATKHPVA